MIDAAILAAALSESSFMDRLDLSSPSVSERERAAAMIAESIMARLTGEMPSGTGSVDQLPLPM